MRRLAWFGFALMFTACGGDDDGGGERRPIADRDLSGSCAGTDCDGPAPGGNCFCDPDCTFYADCCSDQVAVCRSDGAGSCGGFAGLQCEGNTYCYYEVDAHCGDGDQPGLCIAPPADCTDEVVEVCGCDGLSHDNACLAALAGTSVASDGPCP